MEATGDYHPRLNKNRLVHIVDPDAHCCETLCVLFRLESFETAFSVEPSQFFQSMERRQPDVVLVNTKIGKDDGFAVLRRIKAMRAGIPVFMLLDTPSVREAVEALKAGAHDAVPKPIDNEYLLATVRNALRQDVHIGVPQGGHRPVEVRGFSRLTKREREVLELIVSGRSNKEAGRDLAISPRTVEVHRSRVMEKLGAGNTADLMRIVLTG